MGMVKRWICLANGTLPLRSTSGEPIRTGCTSRHSTAGFVSVTCQFHQYALGNVPDIGKWRVPLHADDVSQLVNNDPLHNLFQQASSIVKVQYSVRDARSQVSFLNRMACQHIRCFALQDDASILEHIATMGDLQSQIGILLDHEHSRARAVNLLNMF